MLSNFKENGKIVIADRDTTGFKETNYLNSQTRQEKQMVMLYEAPAWGPKRRKKPNVMPPGHDSHLDGMGHLCAQEDQTSRTEVQILKGLKSHLMTLFNINGSMQSKGDQSISLENKEAEFHFSLSLY